MRQQFGELICPFDLGHLGAETGKKYDEEYGEAKEAPGGWEQTHEIQTSEDTVAKKMIHGSAMPMKLNRKLKWNLLCPLPSFPCCAKLWSLFKRKALAAAAVPKVPKAVGDVSKAGHSFQRRFCQFSSSWYQWDHVGSRQVCLLVCGRFICFISFCFRFSTTLIKIQC